MREIKFRAWDEDEKYFYYSNVTCWKNREGYIFEAHSLRHSDFFEECFNKDVKDLELEQYTGLKDKNGKEIYEGDIVEYINAPGMDDCTASIVWENTQAAFYIENDEADIYDSVYNVYDYSQIIGNIHESPELLNDR